MERITTTQRVLYYLQNQTNERHPEWRTATIEFLSALLNLSLENYAINLNFLKTVGLTAYYMDQTIFYARFNRTHLTLNFHKEWLLEKESAKISSKPAKTGWYKSFIVSEKKEIEALLKYLKSLKRPSQRSVDRSRIIPQWVKNFVMERDGSRCVSCRSKSNLCFDHILPYAKGGLSDHPSNIQLLCSKCNLRKSDNLV